MTTQDIDLGVVARGPQGPKGDKGDVGPAPTLKIGTVTKLNPDQTPTADFTGDNGTYTLNMGIPQGVQGETNKTATNALNLANGANDKLNNLVTSGRNYIKNSESITMYPNGTDNYDLVWHVYNDAFASNIYCHGNNKTKFSFYLKPSKALSTARTFMIYWRASPYVSFGTITVPANTTATQYYELTMTTPTSQPIASQIFIRFMKQDTSDISYTITYSMLTIGDSFPDWQPSPEDIQSEIDANSALIKNNTTEIGNAKTAAANAQSSANGAQSTANTAKSTADSALSKANSNATTLNNKVNKSDLTWANISGKPSIPSTFNGTITDTSTDFNNLTSEGYYDIQITPSYQGKNGPKDGNWGLLDVKVAGHMVVQTYYGDNNANVYVRNRRDGSTWTAWREITFWPRS